MAQYIGGNAASLEDKFRLARIIFSLSTMAIFTKNFGFGEKFVIAHFFGTGDTADRGLFDLGIMIFSAKLAVTTGAVWLALKSLLWIGNPGSFLQVVVFNLMLPGAGALSGFILCSYLLRIDEFKAIVLLLRYRKAAVSTLYGEAK
jgi:hypothetical protein